MNSKFEKLETLQKLKDSNAITEKEFEIEKYKILNEVEAKQTKNTEGIYISSLVLGICSFLFGAIPILGLVLSIVALIISIKSRKKLKTNKDKDGKVTAGFILSILGLIIALFMTIVPLGILIFNFSSSSKIVEPEEVKVPNIVGLSVEQARTEVENAKLKFEVEGEDYDNKILEGVVIAQEPTYREDFKIKKGSTISVIVSNEKEIFYSGSGISKQDKQTSKTNIYDGYLAIIKEHEDSLKNETDFFIEYGLNDIDNNNVEELIIRSGTCNTDTEFTFYTYKDNKVVKLGSMGGANTSLYAMNDGNYLEAISQSMGYRTIYNIYYENNKFEIKNMGAKELTIEEEGEDIQGDVEIMMCDSRMLGGLESLKY